MTEHRLRTRSTSEILDAAFQLYRQDAVQYIAVTAGAYAPWVLIQFVFGTVSGTPVAAGPVAPSLTQALVSLVTAIGTSITFTLMNGVIVQMGADAYLGNRRGRDIGATIRAVLPRLPSLLLAGFYVSLLSGLGFLCFFVGFFYVVARLFAVAPAIVLEGQTAGGSLGRSSVLSRGLKWHVLWTLILTWLIFILAAVAAGIVAGILQSTVLTNILSTVITILVYPIIGLVGMVLYYDARIRSEGFDIEVMAQGLGGAAEG
jgi:hypothetical protein